MNESEDSRFETLAPHIKAQLDVVKEQASEGNKGAMLATAPLFLMVSAVLDLVSLPKNLKRRAQKK